MIVWYIAILFLTTVNGQCSDGCPFPEFSAAAVRLGSKLPNLTHPQCPGDVLTFKCFNGWQMPTDQSAALICQENGEWNATLSRCGK
jgi:Sushi repeat (SCR repeat)